MSRAGAAKPGEGGLFRKPRVAFLATLFLALIAGACTSFSGGGDAGTSAGGMTGSTGGSDGGSVVTYSCYVAGEFCSQLLVQPGGVSAAQQACTSLHGASGTGCPTAGLLGCCQPSASDSTHEEQCYYDPAEVSTAVSTCQTTWTTTM